MANGNPRDVDLGYAIGLKPKDAIEYLESKELRVNWNWHDTWQEAHDRAFVIAKMTRHRLLSQSRKHVVDFLAEGKTIEAAAGELATTLRKAGWWGRRVVVSPAGGAEIVQLGSMHRIKTILRTNMNTAYGAGRYHRQQETADSRPYWQYLAIRDGATRRSHKALHSQTFRADDPFWEANYPPNGFNCRCRVRSLTERQVRRRGIRVNTDTEVEAFNERVSVDKRTGELIERPAKRTSWKDPEGGRREFKPDPGWSYNPGRESFAWAPPRQGLLAIPGQRTWKDYRLPNAKNLPATIGPETLPRAKNRNEALVTLEEALGLDDAKPRRRVRTPVENVLLQQGTLDHIVGKFDAHRERYANRILPTLTDPDEIWLTEYDDGTHRKRYIKLFRGPVRHSLSVVSETPEGQILYNFIPTLGNQSINNQRIGALLYTGGEREGG